MRSSSATSCPSGSPTSRPARVPIYEPGLAELLEANRERLRFTLDIDDVFERARIAFVCVGTPSTYSGDADLSAVWQRARRAAGARRSARARHEEHGPGRDGRAGAPPARQPRARARRLRLEPGVPRRGTARSATSWSLTGSSSAPSHEADGDAVARALRAARRAGRAHGRRLGRDDQARLERVPRHDASASSTRSRTSASRRAPTSRGRRRGHRASTIASGRIFLRAGIGYGGSCFPKDASALKQLAGNSGYHFQLLSRRHRGERAAEAARRREARQAPRLAAGEDGRAPRPRVQAEHERHARGAEPRACARGCSPRAPRCAAGIRSRSTEARKPAPRRRALPDGRSRRSRARTRR